MFDFKKIWPRKAKPAPGPTTAEVMQEKEASASRKPAEELSQNDLYRIIQSTRMPDDFDMEVSYPKPRQFIPIKHPRDMVKGQAYLMSKVSQQSGFKEDCFIPYFMVPVENFAAWVQLLPASEDWHHSTLGGLFAHSLDVGLRALKIFENRNLYVEGTAVSREGNLPRFRLACFLAGLLHDVGKIFEDISVINRKGEMWVPQIEPLYTWALRTESSDYQIIWRKGRYLESHELYTAYYIRSIIPTSVLQYLSEGDPNVARILVGALSSNASDVYGRLWNIIKTADTTSSQFDLVNHKNDKNADAAREFAFPTGIKFIEVVKRLLDDGVWTINKPKGQVYVFEHGAFVLWNKLTFGVLSPRLKAVGFPAYTHSMEVARLIVESSVAAPNEVPLGETQEQGFQMVPLWKIHVEGDGEFLALRIPQAARLLGERTVTNATNCRLVDMTAADISDFGTLLDFDDVQAAVTHEIAVNGAPKVSPLTTSNGEAEANQNVVQSAPTPAAATTTTDTPSSQPSENPTSTVEASEGEGTPEESSEKKNIENAPEPHQAPTQASQNTTSTEEGAAPPNASETSPSQNPTSNREGEGTPGETSDQKGAAEKTQPPESRIKRIDPKLREAEPAAESNEAAASQNTTSTVEGKPTDPAAFAAEYEDDGFLYDKPSAQGTSRHAAAILSDEDVDEDGGEIVDAEEEEGEARSEPATSTPEPAAKPYVPTLAELMIEEKAPRALQVTDGLMVSMSRVLKQSEAFTLPFFQLLFEVAVSECAQRLRADTIRGDQKIPSAWLAKMKDVDMSDEAEAVTVHVMPPCAYARDTTSTAITLAALCRITGGRTELVARTLDAMCAKEQAVIVNLKPGDDGRFAERRQMSCRGLVQSAANEAKTGAEATCGVVFKNQLRFVIQAIESDFDNAAYRKSTVFELSANTLEGLQKLECIVTGKAARQSPLRKQVVDAKPSGEVRQAEADDREVVQLHVTAGANMKMIFESLIAQIEAGQGPWIKTLIVTKDVCTLEDSCLDLIAEQYGDFTADKLRARIQAEEHGFMGFKIRGTKIFFNKSANGDSDKSA